MCIIFLKQMFLNFFHFFLQESNTYGVIEVGVWVLRVLIAFCGMISTQSLYSKWRDQKTVLKSLQSLSVVSLCRLAHYQKIFD